MKQNGLEIDPNVAYHRRFWKVQRIGWICWTLAMIAAFSGLFGPGIKGKEIISDAESGLALTLERIVRYQAPAELEIRFDAAKTDESEIRLAINRSCIEAIESLTIIPEPEQQEALKENIYYTFHRAEPSEPMTVLFRYETKKTGTLPIQLQFNDHPALFAKQFIFP